MGLPSLKMDGATKVKEVHGVSEEVTLCLSSWMGCESGESLVVSVVANDLVKLLVHPRTATM